MITSPACIASPDCISASETALGSRILLGNASCATPPARAQPFKAAALWAPPSLPRCGPEHSLGRRALLGERRGGGQEVAQLDVRARRAVLVLQHAALAVKHHHAALLGRLHACPKELFRQRAWDTTPFYLEL